MIWIIYSFIQYELGVLKFWVIFEENRKCIIWELIIEILFTIAMFIIK